MPYIAYTHIFRLPKKEEKEDERKKTEYQLDIFYGRLLYRKRRQRTLSHFMKTQRNKNGLYCVYMKQRGVGYCIFYYYAIAISTFVHPRNVYVYEYIPL